jgi:hypothetical protein
MAAVRKRVLVVLGAFAVGSLGLVGACGFPSPFVADIPDEEGGSEAGSVDVLAFEGNENVDPNGKNQEAGTRPDAAVVDAAGCVDKCDCDEDDYVNEDCDGGTDCKDLDPTVPYHDGFLEDVPPPGYDGDWNCDGTVTKQYASGVMCGVLGVAGCTGVEGFTGQPGCGVEGAYVTCAPNTLGLLCAVSSTVMRKQGCK